jgi:hypothetical protein
LLATFFKLAAVSPGRQAAFRNLVVMHLVILAGGAAMASAFNRIQRPCSAMSS